MLLCALETLHSSTTQIDFDIIIYYDLGDYNFSNIHKYDITKLYPNVIFASKILPTNAHHPIIPNPSYYYKWLCIEDIVTYSSYNQIAYFDCDVIFLQDFNKLFDIYRYGFNGLFEGYDEFKIGLIGTPHGMSSGQFIFERKLLLNITGLFRQVIKKGAILCDIIDKSDKLARDKSWFKALNEQYAGHRVLLDHKIPIRCISTEHVKYGPTTCDIIIDNQDVTIIKPTTEIIHYTNYNAFVFVPSRFRNEHLNEQFDRNIKHGKLNRFLWG